MTYISAGLFFLSVAYLVGYSLVYVLSDKGHTDTTLDRG
jgi:hypothetical protein